MAQSVDDTEKEKQLRIKLHRTISNSRLVKANGKTLEFHHLGDLQDITPYQVWGKDGVHKYEGTAEFFFVPDDDNGYRSQGNRLKFFVNIKKCGNCFEILDTLSIHDKIIITGLKQIKEDK